MFSDPADRRQVPVAAQECLRAFTPNEWQMKAVDLNVERIRAILSMFGISQGELAPEQA